MLQRIGTKVSPHDEALRLLGQLRRQAGTHLIDPAVLHNVWQTVISQAQPPIAPENIAWQWLRLRQSVIRINAEQRKIAQAGNLSQAGLFRRIMDRVSSSVVESCRRVVIAREYDRASASDEPIFARMLHTAADEPDLAHALLEGKIMPLEQVLDAISRFGCQHEYEIVKMKPISAHLDRDSDRWVVDEWARA
jgi:hypothetical protein